MLENLFFLCLIIFFFFGGLLLLAFIDFTAYALFGFSVLCWIEKVLFDTFGSK